MEEKNCKKKKVLLYMETKAKLLFDLLELQK